jgi:flagellin
VSAGNTAITVALSTGATLTGAEIADTFEGATVTIDNVVYDITAKDGILTLTGKSAPTSSTVSKNFTVALTQTKGSNNKGNGQSVSVEAQAISNSATKMAQGKFTLNTDIVKDGNVLNIGGTNYTFKVGADSTVTGENLIDLSAYDPNGSTNEIKNMITDAAAQISNIDNDKFIVTTVNKPGSTMEINITEKVDKVDYAKDYDLSTTAGWNTKGIVTYGTIDSSKSTSPLTLQIGDTSDSWNQMTVSINDMHTKSLGIDDIDIKTQSAAASAISVIKDAINYVSSTRGTLGATQNRLEHTANNLSVMTENIQDAESTIRDTDIADEMTAYTKNQILVQSAQAMLAQANSVPQGVLQLLQ